MYSTDTLDQKWLKNLKPDTYHLSVESRSHISGSTENIIREQLISSYYLSPNPDDQIPHLIQEILNLIIQAVNTTVAKALDQRFELDY